MSSSPWSTDPARVPWGGGPAPLVDLVLTAGTGFEVIEFIKSAGAKPAHVVVVTAADPSTLAGLDRDVVKRIFFKPFNVERFASYVQTLTN